MRTAARTETGSVAWRRNTAVCAAGSFTTITGMTLILPIMPLYVRQLGVNDPSQVTTWSGIAYAVTFLAAALTAPLWGHLGDRFGRKPMLIRASLGMAVTTSLIGFAHNIWQLVLLRLLTGLVGGYASGSNILVAAQAPRERTGWALGTLTSAIMAGNVLGPLLGGSLAQTLGVRATFLATGGLIFLAFLATTFLLHEHHHRPARTAADTGWRNVPNKAVVLALLGLSTLLMVATLSVEPIITVYVEHLTGTSNNLALLAAIVFSLTALGTILSGPLCGRLADRVGTLPVLATSLLITTILLALQAITPDLWTFAGLRFLTGIALGGITPAVISTLRRLLPTTSIGLVLGYNVSAQYLGQVTGPVLAGCVAGPLGPAAVFTATAAATALALAVTLTIRGAVTRSSTHEPQPPTRRRRP